MILWDILFKEHESGIKSMSQVQQSRFAACCICESVLYLTSQQDSDLNESFKNNLKDSIALSAIIADGMNHASEVQITEDFLSQVDNFIDVIENSPTQIPGVYDLAMALFTFVEALKKHSIVEQVFEIASYSYQAILDEQLMFKLPEGGVLASELVILEEKNLICTQMIATQIDWYERIRDDRLISNRFGSLR